MKEYERITQLIYILFDKQEHCAYFEMKSVEMQMNRSYTIIKYALICASYQCWTTNDSANKSTSPGFRVSVLAE